MSYYFSVAEGGETKTESCGGPMGAKVSLYILYFMPPTIPGGTCGYPILHLRTLRLRLEVTCSTAEVSGCRESPQGGQLGARCWVGPFPQYQH